MYLAVGGRLKPRPLIGSEAAAAAASVVFRKERRVTRDFVFRIVSPGVCKRTE